MSLEEDWAVEQVRELAKRVKRLEDETGITEADRKAAKEARKAEREAEAEADDSEGDADSDDDRSPRARAEQQVEDDDAAKATQALADLDGPAGITEASRAKADAGEPTKDPQNKGDDYDPTKGDDPEPEFDPGRHTVGEVNARLRSADPGERDRILAAERAGKNRSGIAGT